jgi:nicotinic acid mononucleotide adenylyltransferase
VADGFDPTFIVGADKLVQLADPSFYPDGRRGAAATFDEVTFLVVPRSNIALDRPGSVLDRENIRLLDVRPDGGPEPDGSEVFTDPRHEDLSATDVRRMVAAGIDVSNLVPPEVAAAIGGYTSAR